MTPIFIGVAAVCAKTVLGSMPKAATTETKVTKA
jgi:hypothetical protein